MGKAATKKAVKRQAKTANLLAKLTERNVRGTSLRKKQVGSVAKGISGGTPSMKTGGKTASATGAKKREALPANVSKAMEEEFDDVTALSASGLMRPKNKRKRRGKKSKKADNVPTTGVTSTQRIVRRKARQSTLAKEMQHMQNVLADDNFRANPLLAVQQHIKKSVAVMKSTQEGSGMDE